MFEKIVNLYTLICMQEKLDKEYAVVFVYNEPNHIRDTIHNSECVSDQEKIMIVNSFRKSAEFVYEYSGEDIFLLNIDAMLKKHKHILVYSMAQNLNGAGRRSLIPLMCEYYNLINIGSDFLSSTLGGAKKIMQALLENNTKIVLPRTEFIDNFDDIQAAFHSLPSGKYLLKPIDESASIGVQIYQHNTSIDSNIQILRKYLAQYPHFMIQEFICGEEIEVPLLYYDNDYHCPGISKIENLDENEILSYDTIKLDNYDFSTYKNTNSDEIINISKLIAQKLGFYTISRIDFRVKGGIAYLIDLGANPTISYHSTTNFLFRKHLQNDETAVYRLLLYKGLIINGLFEPSFH